MYSVIPDFGTLYYVCEWLVRIAMLLVVPLRRSPEATRSWLLAIFFLPIPGLLLYLAIGRPKFPAWRTQRFKHARSELAGALAELPSAASPGECATLAARLGGFSAVPGNSLELLREYDATISRIIEDIDSAQLHVRMVIYIFANDTTGKRVAAALARAVQRGVIVHVLVDPVGSYHWLKGSIAMLRAAGVHVREALPFHWLRDRTRRDMRNHRKLFVIDGVIGYAGSLNIVDKTFRPGIENRELVARVTGPVVAQIAATILSDWYLETEIMPSGHLTVPAGTGAVEAQLLPSGANFPLEGFQTLLIWQIHRATRQVIITSPYFIPDEGLLGAMRTAVMRGVDVHLIVSAVIDQPLVGLAQRSYYSGLLRAGVQIHLFRKYLLHAKNVSIDGELGIVGSSNVDLRSFQLNEEVSLLLHDRASVAALEAIQQDYIAHSDPLDARTWSKRPRARKVAENIARMVSPLL